MLGKPLHASLITSGELCILLYHLVDAVIIVHLDYRTHRARSNHSAGSTGTHHSGDGLVDLLSGLHFLLRKLCIVVHLVDDLHHSGSGGWRRSHHFLLLGDGDHILLNLEIVNLVVVLYHLHLTLCELKGNEQRSKSQHKANQYVG